ncbi:MAG: molecular chaperone HtpG [Acidobacteria bacterium]|nr:molecular chaperone HtpG [Acidobacteriota bacterium]
MSDKTRKTTRKFQTEARQLLQLMIHSLYSNKEIFLRELISNASDACDKLRFEALTEPALLGEEADFAVQVRFDATARTITVTDNGVGMSRQEVIDNIGTIARSGTQEFLAQLTGDQARDAQLIGQFGVGFYSSFIVADRVTLTTRRAGLAADDGVRWESTGEGSYTLEAVSRGERGTEVTLHLRDGEDELLDAGGLRTILRKYSDHISVPIVMEKEAVPGKQADTGDIDKTEQVNRAAALWTRPRSEIKAEQYDEFYKHVAHDFEAPLAHLHARIEGRQDFTLLLYIPRRAPFDIWDRQRRHGIKLYVRRVFIMENAEEIMRAWLRFVRGVIDSNDLPLNVSREILQHSQDVDAIRAAAVKRVLGRLDELADKQPEQYATFWEEFGRVVKEGVSEDPANKDRIARLLRFTSTRAETAGQTVALADYAARMPEGQEAIYYITADSLAAARNSPHLEIFRKKGIEVLLLHDRIDEWVAAHLTEFEGKPLQSVAKGDLDLGKLADSESDAEQKDKLEDEFKPVLERIRKALEGRANEVRITYRLTESPACLVGDKDGISANLERMLRAAGQDVPNVPLALEINPTHPIVERLKAETDETRFADWSRILFDQALLAEGGKLDDPAAFVKRLNALMLALSGEPAARIWTPGG